MDFGWKKKVDRLRRVILSGGHQFARELSPGISRILEAFARAAKMGDGRDLQGEITVVSEAEPKLLWEPLEVYGWEMHATLYLRDGQLWWLVYAARKNEAEPRDKEVAFLDKVLEYLGAEPSQHMIIGPRSSPPGEPTLPFGWWTWRNQAELLDIQTNRDKVRVVPIGTPETEGYRALFPGRTPDDGSDET